MGRWIDEIIVFVPEWESIVIQLVVIDFAWWGGGRTFGVNEINFCLKWNERCQNFILAVRKNAQIR